MSQQSSAPKLNNGNTAILPLQTHARPQRCPPTKPQPALEDVPRGEAVSSSSPLATEELGRSSRCEDTPSLETSSSRDLPKGGIHVAIALLPPPFVAAISHYTHPPPSSPQASRAPTGKADPRDKRELGECDQMSQQNRFCPGRGPHLAGRQALRRTSERAHWGGGGGTELRPPSS